jgi:hypothetical protein
MGGEGVSPTFRSQVITILGNSRPLKSFKSNTYGYPRKCCKQKTYSLSKPFRCNTYKKQGEGYRGLPVD